MENQKLNKILTNNILNDNEDEIGQGFLDNFEIEGKPSLPKRILQTEQIESKENIEQNQITKTIQGLQNNYQTLAEHCQKK
ncbi:hypothetical protein pb186bvf_001223 [Paramecium bursaria]